LGGQKAKHFMTADMKYIFPIPEYSDICCFMFLEATDIKKSLAKAPRKERAPGLIGGDASSFPSIR
jgi:hypothetical protein